MACDRRPRAGLEARVLTARIRRADRTAVSAKPLKSLTTLPR